MTSAPSTAAFTYDELDAILRGTGGHDGAIGMSAIDGLIAALVAAPAFVHPDEWVPLIFGGRRPRMDDGSPEERAVRTVFNRYNEVSTTLAEQPNSYRPIFMIDQDGSVVARDWAVGFMLGIGLRSQEWAGSILLTEHRSLLTPILVYHDLGDGLLPEMPPAEKHRQRATAYQKIPQAVAAIRAICNAHRAAEALPQPNKLRRARRTRR
jgi:yecA family protein